MIRLIFYALFFVSISLNGIAAATEDDDFWGLDDAWDDPEPDIVTSAYYYNIDLYYSNAGWLFNLSDSPIPDVGKTGEWAVYSDLLKRSLIPQFLLFELSVNPLPMLGTYIRDQHESFYNDMEIRPGLNLVESATTGFEEPFALSLFFNNMVTYNNNGESSRANIGFMGYLLNIGNYHIQRNRLIKDQWAELEWKIKGDIVEKGENLSWSFRVGGKFHNHPEITDTFYVTLKRSRINHGSPLFAWLTNSAFEATYAVDQKSFNSVELQIILAKQFPITYKGAALSLGIGFIHNTGKKYQGELQETFDGDNSTIFVFRPGFEF